MWGASEDIATANRINAGLDSYENWEADFEEWFSKQSIFQGDKYAAKVSWRAAIVHLVEREGGRVSDSSRKTRYA